MEFESIILVAHADNKASMLNTKVFFSQKNGEVFSSTPCKGQFLMSCIHNLIMIYITINTWFHHGFHLAGGEEQA